jgi:stearoyl-CoA desaturase (delta-9 desaturase)
MSAHQVAASLEGTPGLARPAIVRNALLERNLFRHGVLVYAVPHLAAAVYLPFYAWQQATLLNLSLLATMSFATSAGVEIGYHRLFAHRTFKTGRFLSTLLAALAAAAGQGSPIYWASTHRRHHKFADGPGDPHSPRLAGTGRLSALRGFVHAHVGWLFGHGITNTGVFGRDLLGDPQLLAVNRLYPMLVLAGLLLPGVIAMAADGTVTAALHGAMWGGVLRLVVVQELTFSVNSVCHLWGSRPHERGAFATNNPLLALFTVGSAWHNNHHAFPYSAVFSLRRGEIDIAGLLILGLSKLGLVTDVSKAPSISTHQGE